MTRRLSANATSNVLQALIGACLLFGLYRFIIARLGVEQLGVWSVVLATVSASRLADLGLSAGVTRFVARDRARNHDARAREVIDTAALTLVVTVGAVLPLLYPALEWLLPHLFSGFDLEQARQILPYALISLWLTIISAVYQGGLDGCERMDYRAGLVVTGQLLLLVLAILLVPRHGLLGLAWAQIAQGIFLLIAGRLLLRRAMPELARLPRSWNKQVLKEMLGYGANLQAATVFMLLLDPVAKALMVRFGGAASAGYFEIASQVVVKARAIIVAANQAIVPHMAAMAENEPARLGSFYHQNIRVLALVSLPAFSLLIAWAGGISWLLVGTYESEFVHMLYLLAVAWGSNIFASPAYFTNVGTGQVGWNTLTHIMMGVLNATLGWVLGSHFGASGVAFAYAIALVTGSAMLVVVFQRRHGLKWRSWFGREHAWLAVSCAFVIAYSWVEPLRQPLSGSPFAMAGIVLPPLVLGLAAWFHPMRQQLSGWVVQGMKT